jgi:NADH-quinone oxidoreductase subunit L
MEMFPIVKYLWLIPVLPLLAAGVSALLSRKQRGPAAALAIGAMSLSLVLSLIAFATTLLHKEGHEPFRQVFNVDWLTFGTTTLQLGWVLDPLTGMMLVMVTFVGLLIFIYSIGYMAHDENFKQFFCFLALFAAAMLGIVISNSLLLLFISWELVGLASYLLIGFWFHKPSAAAAAKKAFITTRIGDMGFLLGMLWLYSSSGTLLFYVDDGTGCLQADALQKLMTQTTICGLTLSTAIGILIFCGAVGKSGQVPLHVWLPDAMEGPTPVSALIHAATMVAAGVFLVARVYPLMSASLTPQTTSIALQVVTWVGAITAVFAACIAVAQNDIKRILAYSTVSQLGYMMLGLGVGGVAVGMFHLITHAFFKALLFMGSGSVIHGCHEEQDVRKMGGLRRFMPVTFFTYAIGMMALCGVPLFFSGFWSKDEILASAHHWNISQIPFYLGLIGAFLTAFYMTRQMCYVFFGKHTSETAADNATTHAAKHHKTGEDHSRAPHESPSVMTTPLVILAVFAILLGFIGTPAWPWFHAYVTGHPAELNFSKLMESGGVMAASILIVFAAIGLSAKIYAKIATQSPASRDTDPLNKVQPALWKLLANKFFIDELYEATVIQLNRFFSVFSDWLDRAIWSGAVSLVSHITLGLSWFNRKFDEDIVNGGFDHGCDGLREGSRGLSRYQGGQIHRYLRTIGVAFVMLVLFLMWGSK